MAIALTGINPASFVAISSLGGDNESYVLNHVYYAPGTGKFYRFVYNPGADTIVAGDVVGWFSTTPAFGHVSSTSATIIVEAITSSGWASGIGVHSIATLKYGFLQVGGPCETVTTDQGVAKGHGLVLDGTTDRADSVAAGEEHLVFGYALEDDATTTLSKSMLTLAH